MSPLFLFDFTSRTLPSRVDGSQIGAHSNDPAPRDELDQVKPVCSNIGDGSQLAPVFRKQAPVEIGVLQQSVLHIRAGHVQHFTQGACANAIRSFVTKRIKADVVRHPGHSTNASSDANQLGGFTGIHCQGFFTEHMFAGSQSGGGLFEVKPIRRCEIYGIDRFICQPFIERRISARSAEALGGVL